MRDIKTLLELLLKHWESSHHKGNESTQRGLCRMLELMHLKDAITWSELKLLDYYIHDRLSWGEAYLFYPYLYKERIEWLQQQIESIDSEQS